MITALTYLNAGEPGADGPGEGTTLALLSTAEGFLADLTSGIGILGIIALCVAAAAAQ